jgi:hypothetical protein
LNLAAHATVNQNTGKHVTAFVFLRNILNAHYESFVGYYMPGISLTLGVRTKFEMNKEQRTVFQRKLFRN